MPLSDEAVICTWMEPMPHVGEWPASINRHAASPDNYPTAKWWKTLGATTSCSGNEPWGPWLVKGWEPRPLDLDALWEVEERLSCVQNVAYRRTPEMTSLSEWGKIHADAPTRIKALASVLRPLIEVSK